MLNNKDKIKIFKKIMNDLDVVQDKKSKKMSEELFKKINISELNGEQIDSLFNFSIVEAFNSFRNDVNIKVDKTLYTGSSPYIVQVFVLLRNMLIILKRYNFSEKEIEYIINNIIKFSNL